MTPADKVRFMRGVPKHATYIKDCIRSFWKLQLKPALGNVTNIRSESFWHNHRFQVKATVRERNSFSTILEVRDLGDVFDSATNQLRTRENWALWVQEKYTEEEGRDAPASSGTFFRQEADRLYTLTQSIPEEVIR